MKLNDLPDEILLIIFKKIDNIEVLYSFIGVNKRFNKLVHDSIFTNCLTMTRCSSNGSFDRLDNQILDRFCLQILPEIHDKIKWLDVEFSSMEDVLLCTNYPNLSGLGLHNIEKDTALSIFTGERFSFEFLVLLQIDDTPYTIGRIYRAHQRVWVPWCRSSEEVPDNLIHIFKMFHH